MTNSVLTQGANASGIVKPMERGQITIPVKIRKKLNITPQSWLWIKVVKDKILIEPVEKKPSPALLADYLLSIASDSQVYWKKEDDQNLKRVSKKSKERLKKLI